LGAILGGGTRGLAGQGPPPREGHYARSTGPRAHASKPHAAADAELYVLAAHEAGRHTPFGVGYEPQFFFGPTDVTGAVEAIEAPSGDGLVHPGQRSRVAFRLQRPIALEAGM
jgi:elongation factor Tu